jgi:hypothetical protein
MRRIAVALLSSLVVLAPRPIAAQTLDELQHPLLTKGKAAVSADYDTYAIEHFAISLGEGEMTFFEPQYVLLPAIAFGLGRNVQLRVVGSYQFPALFAYPMFEPWQYIREKTVVKSLSGELLFRPRPNLELGGAYLFGRSTSTSNYARSRTANALATEHFNSSVISIHGTWLPSARTVTRTVRSDLAGLHHPLLERHRWRIDGELMGRWYGHDFHDSDDVSPDFVADEIRSRDVRLRLGAAHGISDRIQVAADAYWHPPFRMTDTVQSLWSGDGTVPRTNSYAKRFQGVFGVRFDGRWRPVGRVEAFGMGTWQHQAVSRVAPPVPSPAANCRTSTLTAGGTWLSRQPRRSETLTADVPGLYHPLVEPKQVKIDGFVYYQAYREPAAILALDVRVYRLQATTGIFSWLQASAYGGALLSKHYMSGGNFERSGSYGGELKLRLKTGAELYGTLEQHRAGFVGRYPMFVPRIGDPLGSYVDFLNPDFEGTYTAHLGVRFVF